MLRVNAWLVVGTMIAVGVIVLVVINNSGGNDEESRVPAIDDLGPEITSLCDEPEEATITGVVPIEDDYPRKLALLDEEGFSGFQKQLPPEWFAGDIEELDVVVCVLTERITVQECEYEAEGTSDEQAILYRTKGVATMYAFTPDGSLFDIIEAEGFDPTRCPNSLNLRDDDPRELYENGPLTHNFIQDALAPLATGIHPKQPMYPFDTGEGTYDEE